jgi:hypothetical protein
LYQILGATGYGPISAKERVSRGIHIVRGKMKIGGNKRKGEPAHAVEGIASRQGEGEEEEKFSS